jgi:hypothetical protein
MAGSIATAFPTSFKGELPQAVHNFTITTGNVFKCALVASALTGNVAYGAATTNYGAGSGTPTQANLGTDEQANGSGYSTGGFAWTAAQNLTPLTSGTGAYWQWSVNPSWTGLTASVAGCEIYNSSATNKVVYVGSFGGTQSVVSGTLTLVQPTNGVGTSLLQLN